MAHVALVVPSESYRADSFLQAAERLGHRLTVLTDASAPLGTGVITVASLEPGDAVPSLAETLGARGVDAVVGVDESSVRLAAALSDALGLSEGRLDATIRATDKRLLRETLLGHELPQPSFVTCRLGDWTSMQAATRRALLAPLGTDLVAKPTRCSGSRGVVRTTPEELEATLALLGSVIADDDEVQIETYVAGEEYAVEGILTEGQLELLMVFAKPGHGTGPYFWESIYLGPAPLGPAVLANVRSTLERAASALGLTDTPIHAEVRIAKGVVTIIELAPRTIGGKCAAALTFDHGRRLEDLVLARALGDRSPTSVAHQAVGIYMIEPPRDGILGGFAGVEEVRHLPWIQGVELTMHPGQPILAPPRTERYPGFVFAAGPSRRLVQTALEAARSRLEVVVLPPD